MGCLKPIDANQLNLVSIGNILLSIESQCKSICFNNVTSFNQIFLVKKTSCACVSLLNEISTNFIESGCGDGWYAYIASSMRTLSEDVGLGVTVLNSGQPLEVGQTVPFNISFKSSMNYKVNVDFGDASIDVIGNGLVFHEYSQAGVYPVTLTAISLSDPSIYKTAQIEVQIVKPADRLPMTAVNLDFIVSGERSIDLIVKAFGGSPFSCTLNYGDSTVEPLYSETRSLVYRSNHTYSMSGVYNASVSCLSNLNDIQIQDWSLVYLPNKAYGSYLSSEYEILNFKQIYIKRPISTDADVELELPFSFASTSLKFQAIDTFNTDNLFEWSSTSSIPKNSNNQIFKLKAKFLKKTNDNYFQVKKIAIFFY